MAVMAWLRIFLYVLRLTLGLLLAAPFLVVGYWAYILVRIVAIGWYMGKTYADRTISWIFDVE